jgi:hypothetical protein
MKSFTYAAAIALLTASAAFAQPSGNSSSSMQNTPAQDRSQAQPMFNHDMSGTESSQPADIKSKMNESKAKPSSAEAAMPKATSQRLASRAHATDRSENARENRITAQLNRQQLAGAAGMSASGSISGNSFNNGSPQQAQAGGPNCTPDNPSCGTARQNPAIQSSPEHRTYGASPE